MGSDDSFVVVCSHYDDTRYAKLAAAPHCESSVPIAGVSNAEACQGAATQAYLSDWEDRCVVAFDDFSSLVTDVKVWKSGTTWSECGDCTSVAPAPNPRG